MSIDDSTFPLQDPCSGFSQRCQCALCLQHEEAIRRGADRLEFSQLAMWLLIEGTGTGCLRPEKK